MELEELNSRLNAFVTIREIRPRRKGPLRDLTFGVKDVIFTKGVRTTAGSRILASHVPAEDALVVERILNAGGTIVGKTNTHEFAAGATNTSSIAGPARNPKDPSRISGGSSGGSAVGVAAGMFDVGLGTDTGGSIRVPASLCGVVGFKPTAGIISNAGIIPLSWTLDTVGLLAQRVDLVRRVFGQLLDKQRKSALTTRVKAKLRLGAFLFSNDEASKALGPVVDRIARRFELVDIDFPLLRESGAKVRRTITLAEAAAFHDNWLKTKRDQYFPDVRELLLRGTSIAAKDYVMAIRLRNSIVEEYVAAFSRVDAVVSPTTRISAPKISDATGRELDYREDLLGNAELFNALGAPSISVPLGQSGGMPVGLMLSGRPFGDGALLDIAEKVASAA